MNFSKVLRHHADRAPDTEAIKDVKRRLTWRDLDRRVDALAAGLLENGIDRGDIVALLLFNCVEHIEVALAANRIGAAFLPLNWRLAGEELRYVLDHSGARAIVSESAFLPVLEGILDRLPSLALRLGVDGPLPPDWLSYHELLDRQLGVRARVPDAEVGADDLHRLMYTSGTTAHPKGVMLTFANLYWKNIAHVVEFGLTSRDRTLVVGPLYHVGALDLPGSGVLYAGGSLAILEKFSPVPVLEAIQRESPTIIWLAPAMVIALLAEPSLGEYDLSSVRLIIDGGEKMPETLIAKLQAAFPKAWFADAYGLTETVSGDTFLDKTHTLYKLGSVGKPVVHLDVKIVDDDDREVPAGETGEIVLRGPKVFKGYWRDPESTASAIRNGWFHTGDIGRVDAEGFLYIVDRKKDIIISGGENIASLEVERVLYEHPAVVECAVVGMPDPKWGEVPVAFAAVKPGQLLDDAAVAAFCTGRLAKFKIPKKVFLVDQLPRNPSGKVLKRVLRESIRSLR